MRLFGIAAIAALLGCGWDAFAPVSADGGAGGMGMGGDPTTGGGPATGGAGGGTARCGTAAVLSDDFADDIVSPQWLVELTTGGTMTEVMGTVTANSTSSSNYRYFRSSRWLDARDSAFSVQVAQMCDITTPGWVELRVFKGGGNGVYLAQSGGQLLFGRHINSARMDFATAPFDALADKYFQIREEAGTVHWETSADGSSWQPRHSEPTAKFFPFDRVLVRFGLEGNGASSTTPTGPAVFADFRGSSLDGTGGWCKAHTLWDDFGDSVRSREWLRSGGSTGFQALEYQGALIVSLPLNAPGNYDYVSSQAFDLGDSAVAVEVADVPTQPAGRVYLRASDGPSAMELKIIADEVRATYNQAGSPSTVNVEPYDPARHRWLRLSVQTNTAAWETSADGVTWETIGSLMPPPVADVSTMDIVLGVGTDGDPDPGTGRLDNFNLAP